MFEDGELDLLDVLEPALPERLGKVLVIEVLAAASA